MKGDHIIAYIDALEYEIEETLRDFKIIALETNDVDYETAWQTQKAFEYAIERFEMYSRALRDKLNEIHF